MPVLPHIPPLSGLPDLDEIKGELKNIDSDVFQSRSSSLGGPQLEIDCSVDHKRDKPYIVLDKLYSAMDKPYRTSTIDDVKRYSIVHKPSYNVDNKLYSEDNRPYSVSNKLYSVENEPYSIQNAACRPNSCWPFSPQTLSSAQGNETPQDNKTVTSPPIAPLSGLPDLQEIKGELKNIDSHVFQSRSSSVGGPQLEIDCSVDHKRDKPYIVLDKLYSAMDKPYRTSTIDDVKRYSIVHKPSYNVDNKLYSRDNRPYSVSNKLYSVENEPYSIQNTACRPISSRTADNVVVFLGCLEGCMEYEGEYQKVGPQTWR